MSGTLRQKTAAVKPGARVLLLTLAGGGAGAAAALVAGASSGMPGAELGHLALLFGGRRRSPLEP